jgi:hypothetical protein
MSHLFFRRGIYNKYYKKEEVYDRVVLLYRIKGIFKIFGGITFLLIDFLVVPEIYKFYDSYNVTPPIFTQASFYIIIFLSLFLCFWGVQLIIKEVPRQKINEKLSHHSKGELVNISEFFDYKSNHFYFIIIVAILTVIVTGLIIPLYDLIAKIEHEDEIFVTNSEIDSWKIFDIKNSAFAFKHPETTVVEETSECIKITYGLAFITIAKPGKNSTEICFNKYDLATATKPLDLDIIIDEVEYKFDGFFLDGRKNPEKKNAEIYKNTNGIFGNGYSIELGGSFENNTQQQYIRDKAVVKAILESTYRRDL